MAMATLDIDGNEWLGDADEVDPGSYDYAVTDIELRLALVETEQPAELGMPADLLSVDAACFVSHQG